MPISSATPLLISIQRRSSRCSRNVFTGPPPSSSLSSGRGSSVGSAMKKPAAWTQLDFGHGGRLSGGFSVGIGRGRFRGLGRRFVNCPFEFIGHLAGCLFEFINPFAKSLGKFGNPLGAKQDQD